MDIDKIVSRAERWFREKDTDAAALKRTAEHMRSLIDAVRELWKENQEALACATKWNQKHEELYEQLAAKDKEIAELRERVVELEGKTAKAIR